MGFTIFNLQYSADLLKNYQNLTALPGFVLLESSDKWRGRYDILSACPYRLIKLKQDSCTSLAFKQMEEWVPLRESVADLPFQGGAIGFWSYDLGTSLFDIHSHPQPNLLGIPLANIGLYDWAIIADHAQKKVVLFSANTQPETLAITQEILTLWELGHVKDKMFGLKETFKPLLTKSSYYDGFKTIRRSLEEGRCYQVNYTQPFNAPYEGDAWEMYKQVRLKNPVPYSAFLRTEDSDILSFSPERFLLQDNELLLTSPIKGSEKRANDALEDELWRKTLLESSKNRAENVMIVDLLRNDLGKIARPGSVSVPSLCEIQSYTAVHHLVSHIEALRRADVSPFQAFEACFPGGSITGAPKLESMRVIAENEAYARGIYCGSIAYFSHHGRFDSNIAIRTVVARNNILHLAAGGGIVIDSNWEDEYCECFTKIAAILNGLQNSG
ncbi:aminodeoxychorismate synthase, component I [Legionella jamestowniensis]|uniref:aminodeoxychorismate synthase n=2 Tax=Legionella jamestowniensis TaxID=455 RepID=A0A0W0UJV0_9GAMM|nr:aminodeoxychorismate synthase component I [Legionella jamestowniensis]KTD08171.1 para-aminobenzoate synthase, component I [Legionella jamestowniensis]OCH98496.1 aminodeoxychorismate synthase, component I [Legionella jamestowniensis]SFL98984.1 para-aminobenzoate synthetase component 1 [Legionella jamestowniensis DSM 19215]